MSIFSITHEEREQIYLRKKNDESLPSIADKLKISCECVRKWWRRGKQEGLAGLVTRKRTQVILSQFAQEVRQASLDLKRKHKRWGAARILLEMSYKGFAMRFQMRVDWPAGTVLSD